MRNISDTIARLGALRTRHTVQPFNPGGSDRLADLTDFGTNPGVLRARYYLPEQLPDGAPLVVVLHGCTQNAAGYDHGSGWSRLADQAGFALLYPEQQRANNPNLCFNWFQPADTKRDAGEALSIRQMIETLVTTHGLDRSRIYITGLSAGGAMTSVMLASYPEVFAGGAIIAGLPYGSATTIPEAFDRMRGHGGPSAEELAKLLRGASAHKGRWPTISVWHGTQDRTVAPANADLVVAQWRGVHGLRADEGAAMSVDGHRRRVWKDADGRELIESYTISGMDHGTPLATRGDHGLGKPAPFMIEAGISSTLRSARFWGIADDFDVAVPASTQKTGDNADIRRLKVHAGADTAHAPNSASRVQSTIENALRSAGLLRK